jgi:hypothetical protein
MTVYTTRLFEEAENRTFSLSVHFRKTSQRSPDARRRLPAMAPPAQVFHDVTIVTTRKPRKRA